jgi:hypothetical protein
MGAFVPITGFVPDADPTTPGILTACDGWVPSPKGMRAAASAANAGYTAIPAACVGIYVSRYNDGTNAVYAGAATDIYQLSSGSWTSRKGSLTINTSTNWRFATGGNITYASNLANTIAKATTGDFAAIAGAPKASLLATAYGFLICADYDLSGAVPDGIYWSAQYNPDDWTTSVATRCGKLRLLDTPGKVTGLRTLNDQVVAYKERSLYVGADTGSERLWLFRLVSADIGAVSQEAIVDVEYGHFFLGYNGFYVFDGNVPVRIDGGINEWFFANLNRALIASVRGLYDRDRGLIYWFYPGSGSTVLNKWVVYHLPTKRWGAGSLTVEAVVEVLTPGKVWTELYAGTYDAMLAGSAWDSGVSDSSMPYPAVVNSAHTLCFLSGTPGAASFTTGRIGEEEQVALLRRLSPRWTTRPYTASLVNMHTMISEAQMNSDAASSMTASGWFDVLRASRWHAAQLTTTGNAELVGIAIDAAPQGRM